MKRVKERIEKLKYRIDVAGLIIQILNFIKSFIKRYKNPLPHYIYGGEVYDKRIEKKVNLYINVVTLILLIINIIRSK